MNVILFSAVWGVVMMFTGAFIKSKTLPKYIGIAGIILLFITNAMELATGSALFNIDTGGMLKITSYNLTFLAVVTGCTLLFFFIKRPGYGKDRRARGRIFRTYLFFVLCGAALSSTYNTLLLLFLLELRSCLYPYIF